MLALFYCFGWIFNCYYILYEYKKIIKYLKNERRS